MTVPAKALEIFSFLVSIFSFDYFEFTEVVPMNFTPTEPWAFGFEMLDYGSRNVLELMGSVVIIMWIGFIYLVIVFVLSRLIKRKKTPHSFLRPMTAWWAILDFI